MSCLGLGQRDKGDWWQEPSWCPGMRERVCPSAQVHVGVGAGRGAFWGTDGLWGGALPPLLRCRLDHLACLHSLTRKMGPSATAGSIRGLLCCHVVRKWLLLLMNSFLVYVILPFSLAKLRVSAEVQVCLVKEDEGLWSQGHGLLTLTTASSRPLLPLASHWPVVSEGPFQVHARVQDCCSVTSRRGETGMASSGTAKPEGRVGEGAFVDSRDDPCLPGVGPAVSASLEAEPPSQ